LPPPSNLPAVVPVVPAKGRMVLVVPKELGDMCTNYDMTVTNDQVAVSRAMAPADARLDAYVGKTIAVVGVVMNMAEFESQESPGELTEKVYASIVLQDGTIIGTTGKAVMGQLAYLIGASKAGAFDPPVEFEVRQHKSTPPKQPYYSLRRVAAPIVAKGKGVGRAS